MRASLTNLPCIHCLLHPLQVGDESWAFNPPETLGGALLKGNLPGLYSWDSWSSGVALAALCLNSGESPFAAEADVSKLTFSAQVLVDFPVCSLLRVQGELFEVSLHTHP